MLLWGTAFGGVLVAAGSGYKAVLAGPRSGQAPIVAGMVAGIALTMEGQSTEAIAATAIASILVSTIIIGAVLYIIGRAKLGGMVRYIPFPVMGGFFAGLGYLLFKGGLFVSLGSLVDADDLSTFASLDVVLHLAPALGFAVLFYIADSRIKHWLLMPAFLVATVALFYVVLFASGSSISEASAAGAAGWLPSISAGDASFFPSFTPDQLALVDWWAILPQISTILVMMLMSVIMVLLDTSGIEIVTDRDMDPNHELKVAGWGNVVSGFVAAPMVLQASADTAFAYKFGADRFLWILIYGALFWQRFLWDPPRSPMYPPCCSAGCLCILASTS